MMMGTMNTCVYVICIVIGTCDPIVQKQSLARIE